MHNLYKIIEKQVQFSRDACQQSDTRKTQSKILQNIKASTKPFEKQLGQKKRSETARKKCVLFHETMAISYI